ncbi:hypothetical protein Y1Q_0011574 [Alligator mississippiensis]|uniref:Uncharacterized protein n=1 Tax=Alligator mississippiensis TaxID=8496 RepID=A0A151M096_ALLMI|nr:hypothetical protein Y1Q_0011574 [Alligator mississippiensis]
MLVEVVVERKADAQAWQAEDLAYQERWCQEDIAHETTQEAWDWVESKYWAKLLALEQEHLQILKAQNNILHQAVEAKDDDRQTPDTVLGLAVLCMPDTAQPSAPHQPPTGPLVATRHPPAGPHHGCCDCHGPWTQKGTA